MNFEAIQSLMFEKAASALQIPGVIALHPGARVRSGHAKSDSPTVVVTVEQKIPPERLANSEDLRNLFGAERVDVAQATPLQLLFSRPHKYGIDADTLAELENRLGYPFLPQTIGIQPPGLLSDEKKISSLSDHISYSPPDGALLEPLNGRIRLRCHSGPDAGWNELKRFLLATRHELTVGMFDLSAPHIGDLIAGPVAKRAKTFHLVMDKQTSIGSGVKRYDRTEKAHSEMFERAFGEGFAYAYALTSGEGKTFDSFYHIKLATRDREAFWLSSGSWQSSNQPNLDPLGLDKDDKTLPRYNREWHIIGEHAELAETWKIFLEGDLKTASTAEKTPRLRDEGATHHSTTGPFVLVRKDPEFPYQKCFAPGEFEFDTSENRVMPLLTPDNYIEHATKIVESATSELLVQNQNISFLMKKENQDPRFTNFMKILAMKSHEIESFRLILRDPAEFLSSRQAKLDELFARDFNLKNVRFQVGCHNKGFIVDRKTVLIGSHNLTNAGTTSNRDASLIITHVDVAEYYRTIFMHDWGIAEIAPDLPPMRLAALDELPPPGHEKRLLWELLDDD